MEQLIKDAKHLFEELQHASRAPVRYCSECGKVICNDRYRDVCSAACWYEIKGDSPSEYRDNEGDDE